MTTLPFEAKSAGLPPSSAHHGDLSSVEVIPLFATKGFQLCFGDFALSDRISPITLSILREGLEFLCFCFLPQTLNREQIASLVSGSLALSHSSQLLVLFSSL